MNGHRGERCRNQRCHGARRSMARSLAGAYNTRSVLWLPVADGCVPDVEVMGVFGSGMNASGLVLGFNSASGAADKSPEFNPDGTPTMVIGRRFLETCRSRQDAAKWSNQHPTMIQGIAAICDRGSAAIVEITPQSIAILEAAHGLAYCTNRFRSDKLRTIEAPDARYVKLAQSERLDTLAVADVWRLLHDANQGAATIHSMVFEPAKATIHVAFGDGRTSASANNMTSIDLSPWLVPR
jgi:predicted choloylglycine hydrolase